MLPFTVVFASIPLIEGIHALPAESGIPPVPSAIPMTHKAGLDIPQWTKVQMTKNDKTFPADKGPWGGIGPGHWEFAFTPEGNDGGYRREDFDVKLFKHEGNWTLIQEQWAMNRVNPRLSGLHFLLSTRKSRSVDAKGHADLLVHDHCSQTVD